MEIKQLPLSLVAPSPMNPRKTFDEEELQELADITKKQREIAQNLGEARRMGELSDHEQLAFDIILFTLLDRKMLERYGHKALGKPSDRSFIELVKQNQADRNSWIREFIRTTIASTDITFNSLIQHCAGLVLSEWKPKEHEEMVRSINVALDKKIGKLEEKLKDLGYDIHGKLLPQDKKPKVSTPAPAKSPKDYVKAHADMKAKHPKAIVLCRINEFYETFGEDAETVADILKITLTHRKHGKESIALAGFPQHALDTYLPQLIRAGKKVAICED